MERKEKDNLYKYIRNLREDREKLVIRKEIDAANLVLDIVTDLEIILEGGRSS